MIVAKISRFDCLEWGFKLWGGEFDLERRQRGRQPGPGTAEAGEADRARNGGGEEAAGSRNGGGERQPGLGRAAGKRWQGLGMAAGERRPSLGALARRSVSFNYYICTYIKLFKDRSSNDRVANMPKLVII